MKALKVRRTSNSYFLSENELSSVDSKTQSIVWATRNTFGLPIVAIRSKPRISTEHNFTGGRKNFPIFLLYFIFC